MTRVPVLALVAIASLLALGTPVPAQSVDIENWISDLGDENPEVRRSAARFLGGIGQKAASAVPALIAATSDEDSGVRSYAVKALGWIGPNAAPAVPALAVVLFDEDSTVRVRAARALGHVGAKAAPAIPALTTALSDEEPIVRGTAVLALGRIGQRAAPALTAALTHEDVEVRWRAAEALCGTAFGPAIPALTVALTDVDEEVRGCAAWSLGGMGSRAAPAVPALSEALSDENAGVRMHAAGTLGEIGPKAAPAVPALIGALSDETVQVRVRAAVVLAEIGTSLKAQGTVLWWVVPHAYWKELVGLVLLLAAWFGLAGRFPKHQPTSKLKHLAFMAPTAAVPVGLFCSAVYYAITREWAHGFLPDAVTVVPFPVAAVLSTALVCAKPAIWVCQRKTVAVEPLEGSNG